MSYFFKEGTCFDIILYISLKTEQLGKSNIWTTENSEQTDTKDIKEHQLALIELSWHSFLSFLVSLLNDMICPWSISISKSEHFWPLQSVLLNDLSYFQWVNPKRKRHQESELTQPIATRNRCYWCCAATYRRMEKLLLVKMFLWIQMLHVYKHGISICLILKHLAGPVYPAFPAGRLSWRPKHRISLEQELFLLSACYREAAHPFSLILFVWKSWAVCLTFPNECFGCRHTICPALFMLS